MKLRHAIKILLLTPMFIFTLNCGAQRFDAVTSGNTNLGSTETITPGTKPVALCSTDVANRSDFQVRVGVVYNSLGQVDTTKIRFKLINVPQAMIDEKWDLSVYDWGSDSQGNMTDFVKRSYKFERKINNGFQIVAPNNSYTKLNSDEMVEMGEHLSLDLEARQAIDYFSFQVDLGSGTRQVLNLTFYLPDGSKVEGQEINVLMPAFYANPTDYAIGKHSILQNLHPLKDRLGQTWSYGEWEDFTRNMCF